MRWRRTDVFSYNVNGATMYLVPVGTTPSSFQSRAALALLARAGLALGWLALGWR